MKKLLLVIMMLAIVATPIYAALGSIHVLYTNGQIVEDSIATYYEFDIEAYVSEGNEVLGAGMAYVEYPTAVFGDLLINNNKVEVSKIGILEGTFPQMAIYLYDIIENDTYADVFAITFDSPYAGQPDVKQYYSELSNDPLAPSGLLHVKMEVANYGVGYVQFPSYIPGIDNVYYNYELETFAGGVNISEAVQDVIYEDPTPDPVGSVEFKSLVANWKKDAVEVKWSVRNEIDLEGYVVQRSTNGGTPVVVASYLTDPTLLAKGGVSVIKYSYIDADVVSGEVYSYLVEAIDIVGCSSSYGPVAVDAGDVLLTESYPNPFNPSFVVPFELFSTQRVNVKLYDMTGRVVRNITNGDHAAGRYEYHVNCDNLSSGVYLLRTIINDNAHTQKMLLVK